MTGTTQESRPTTSDGFRLLGRVELTVAPLLVVIGLAGSGGPWFALGLVLLVCGHLSFVVAQLRR